MQGPVRFLIPEGGVSLLDAPGQPFHDPGGRPRAVRRARRRASAPAPTASWSRLPHHINDQAFADALVAHFNEIAGTRLVARRVQRR